MRLAAKEKNIPKPPNIKLKILTLSKSKKTGMTREAKNTIAKFEQNSDNLSICLLVSSGNFSFTKNYITTKKNPSRRGVDH